MCTNIASFMVTVNGQVETQQLWRRGRGREGRERGRGGRGRGRGGKEEREGGKEERGGGKEERGRGKEERGGGKGEGERRKKRRMMNRIYTNATVPVG